VPTSTAYMYPVSVYSETPYNGEGGGSWSADNPAAIDDPAGSPNDSDYIVFGPFLNLDFDVDYRLTAPPSGVTVSQIKVWARCWCRSHNSVTVNHTLTIYVKPGGGTRYVGSGQTVTGTNNATGDNPTWFTQVWATNPATAVAWTLSDLAGLVVGINAHTDTDPTGASDPGFKCSSLYVEVTVVPVAANLEGVRTLGSAHLRFFRQPLRFVEVTGPLRLLDADILSRITLSHPFYPTADGLGAGDKRWQRRDLQIISKAVEPDGISVKLKCIDMQDVDCTYWSPMRNDLTITQDQQGVPRLDLGGGWNSGEASPHLRNQTAYVERPLDFLVVDVAPDYPKLSRDGLHIDTDLHTNFLLNSTFSQGAGNAFTSWTSTVTGTGTTTQDTADILFDVTGLRRAAKLTAGTGTAELKQTVNSFVNTNRLRVTIDRKDFSSLTPLSIKIQRSSDSKVWDITNGGWIADAWQTIPGSVVLNRWISNVVLIDGSYNITVYVACRTATAIINVYSVELLGWLGAGQPTVPHVPAGTRLVTTTVAITRVIDSVYLRNDLATRILNPDRGYCHFEFVPAFSNADMANGDIRCLFSAVLRFEPGLGSSALSGRVATFAAFYERVSSGSAVLDFRLYRWGSITGSGYNQAQAALPAVAQIGVPFKAGVRWTSLEQEFGLPARTLSVWGNSETRGDASSTVPDFQDTEWINLTNAVSSGPTLTKSGGVGGTYDAGGSTRQSIGSGADCFIASIINGNADRSFGLDASGAGHTTYTTIDFCWRFAVSNQCTVYENGVSKAGPFAIAAGDELRVTRESGTVKYYLNSVLKYTSIASPAAALYGAGALADAGSLLEQVVIGGALNAMTGGILKSLPIANSGVKVHIGSFNGGEIAHDFFMGGDGCYRKFEIRERPQPDDVWKRFLASG